MLNVINMKRMIIFALILVCCCQIALASAGSTATDVFQVGMNELFNSHYGVPTTDWYEVAPWEEAICYGWGGTDGPNSITSDTSTNMNLSIFHDLVVALQAEVKFSMTDETTGVVSNLYEVSWYIQPVSDDISYEVHLLNASGSRVLASGNANYLSGFKDYYAEYSANTYTSAEIVYYNTRVNDVLTVPVVS